MCRYKTIIPFFPLQLQSKIISLPIIPSDAPQVCVLIQDSFELQIPNLLWLRIIPSAWYYSDIRRIISYKTCVLQMFINRIASDYTTL